MALVFGGEVSNPACVYPRAIFFTIALTVATYFIPMPASVITQTPHWTMYERDSYPFIALTFGGRVLEKFVTFSSVCGIAGLFLSSRVCTASRFKCAIWPRADCFPRNWASGMLALTHLMYRCWSRSRVCSCWWGLPSPTCCPWPMRSCVACKSLSPLRPFDSCPAVPGCSWCSPFCHQSCWAISCRKPCRKPRPPPISQRWSCLAFCRVPAVPQLIIALPGNVCLDRAVSICVLLKRCDDVLRGADLQCSNLQLILPNVGPPVRCFWRLGS
jgi:hypothetical protein